MFCPVSPNMTSEEIFCSVSPVSLTGDTVLKNSSEVKYYMKSVFEQEIQECCRDKVRRLYYKLYVQMNRNQRQSHKIIRAKKFDNCNYHTC